MNDWFNEQYIKEIPIEERIRGQVRAECRYMDKADIYEWVAQNEIKIMNLQSKIDKVIEYIETNKHFEWHTIRNEKGKLDTAKISTDWVSGNKILDILKEDKYE